jgi:prepilin-type N-terminal cleavage/methylation domain-containing protein/prepilin-type processing-associated H-X9-DG protein
MGGSESTEATFCRRAFSLVELLVVIGIIGILLALLMPTLQGARRAARTAQCASNLRQLMIAFTNYATENQGAFPPNIGPAGIFWYNHDVIGKYLPGCQKLADGTVAKGPMICPSDYDQAVRCYSMNTWASSAVSEFVQPKLEGDRPWGKLFKYGVKESSNIIVLIEAFSNEQTPVASSGPMVGYAAPALVGIYSPRPGERLGGRPNGYITTANDGIQESRFGPVATQLSYFRHRTGRVQFGAGEAIGRLNIAFADGHVAMKSDRELYDPETRLSTYVALWSTNDRDADQIP